MSLHTTAAQIVARIPAMAADTPANNDAFVTNVLLENVVDKARFDLTAAAALKLAERNTELESRHAASETLLREANELLRSSWQIGDRDGKETDWPAWRARLMAALEQQRKHLHP